MMNMDEYVCPKCGSIDVMENLFKKRTCICNDCGQEFPTPEEYTDNEYW